MTDCIKLILGDRERIIDNLGDSGYVCFLSNISSEAFAQVAKNLKEAIEKLGLLFCWEQHSFPVTISLGGVHGRWNQFKERAEMFVIAEGELMKAKMLGQNKVKIKFK